MAARGRTTSSPDSAGGAAPRRAERVERDRDSGGDLARPDRPRADRRPGSGVRERLAGDGERRGERARPDAPGAPPVAEPAEQRAGQEAAERPAPLPEEQAVDARERDDRA